MTEATRNLLEQHFDTAFAAPDGVARLRELILTLAMQGKLVEQDPNDPPASELLKEIEREKTSHEGTKTRRKQNLPPIKPEEVPYELPLGWEWVKLNDALDVRDGTHDTPKYVDVGYPLVTSKNIYTGTLSLEDVKYISKEEHEKIAERSKVDKGDILFAMIGSIGNPVIVDSDVEFSIKNVALFKYFLAGKPCNRYLHYYLVHAQDNMKAISSGAVQSFVSLGFLRNYPFPLPPLPEQHRIVARIDQLMTRCDALEKLRKEREEKRLAVHAAAIKQLLDPSLCAFAPSREENSSTLRAFVPSCEPFTFLAQHFGELYAVKENVAELRKAILQIAVMGRLVPQDPNDTPASELLKEIEKEKASHEGTKTRRKEKLPPVKPEEVPYQLPQGWEWVRFAEIAFQITDGAHHTPTYIEDGIPFLSVKDMSSGLLDFSDTRFISPEQHQELIKRCYPQKGDLLLTKVGTTGISVLVDVDFEFSIFVSVALIKFPQQLVSGKFLSLLVKAPLVKKQSEDGTEGVGNKNLVLRKIANFILPLPPLPEQHRIVDRIDQLMALCDTLDQQIDAATDKQTALLSAVMARV